MGLVFEVLFLFFAICYIAATLIKDKVKTIPVERERAEKESSIRSFESMTSANGFKREYMALCQSDGGRKKIEQECLGVFQTLPSWQHIKSWNPCCYSYREASWRPPIPHGCSKNEQSKTLESYYSNLGRLHRRVSECIFLANRGKVDGRFSEFEYNASKCGMTDEKDREMYEAMLKELMYWWRDKIRSFGIDEYIVCVVGDERQVYPLEQFTTYQESGLLGNFLIFKWRPYLNHPYDHYTRLISPPYNSGTTR